MIDWGDLRFVLAIARSGSALRAAQTLGVNQTTVTRRMADLEAQVGAELFERKQSGYHLTPLGRKIAAAAERIEEEVNALESTIGADQRLLAGSVRVTTPEMLANILITPWLRTFRKENPGILVELMAQDRRLDIARGEADVALRAAIRQAEPLQGAGIVARNLSRVGWSVYCSRAYAEENGKPGTLDALDGHAVVALDGSMDQLPGPRLLTRLTPHSRISARSNSLTNLVMTLKAGLGIAMLPCLAGDADPDLVRCLPPIPELEGDLLLVVREEIRSSPHVRAFTESLAAHIKGYRAQLAGDSP
ncbi:LysR family transcriptional regulator [Nordella sp. HKS 07]|uniref:LysR family transcriptional regulator n=1 Tax=Nordella sp. HKS 07 TaxID=2712222 RepID=UPI0013E0FD9F|nr:LysR family transcriptional regulator [Nordella sp. HKS 07]QIG50126.1 LysR family transcriptional regulator [Nordella sp. HKS 07]